MTITGNRFARAKIQVDKLERTYVEALAEPKRVLRASRFERCVRRRDTRPGENGRAVWGRERIYEFSELWTAGIRVMRADRMAISSDKQAIIRVRAGTVMYSDDDTRRACFVLGTPAIRHVLPSKRTRVKKKKIK